MQEPCSKQLPSQKSGSADATLNRIVKLQNDGQEIGDQTAFAYLIGELTANIYELSRFMNAMVMTQVAMTYETGGLSFGLNNNGLSISDSFEVIPCVVGSRHLREP